MFWKVNYEREGRKSCLYYGGITTDKEKNERVQRMKDLGFKIINVYKVKNMN